MSCYLGQRQDLCSHPDRTLAACCAEIASHKSSHDRNADNGICDIWCVSLIPPLWDSLTLFYQFYFVDLLHLGREGDGFVAERGRRVEMYVIHMSHVLFQLVQRRKLIFCPFLFTIYDQPQNIVPLTQYSGPRIYIAPSKNQGRLTCVTRGHK